MLSSCSHPFSSCWWPYCQQQLEVQSNPTLLSECLVLFGFSGYDIIATLLNDPSSRIMDALSWPCWDSGKACKHSCLLLGSLKPRRYHWAIIFSPLLLPLLLFCSTSRLQIWRRMLSTYPTWPGEATFVLIQPQQQKRTERCSDVHWTKCRLLLEPKTMKM